MEPKPATFPSLSRRRCTSESTAAWRRRSASPFHRTSSCAPRSWWIRREMTIDQGRRTLLVSAFAALASRAIAATPTANRYTLGMLFAGASGDYGFQRQLFVAALREHGYIEGENVVLESRFAEQRYER